MADRSSAVFHGRSNKSNNMAAADLVLMAAFTESCRRDPPAFHLMPLVPSCLTSAWLFRRLNCRIIDQRLWSEPLASSGGCQHNPILPFLLCAGGPGKRASDMLRKWYSQMDERNRFLVPDDFQEKERITVIPPLGLPLPGGRGGRKHKHL